MGIESLNSGMLYDSLPEEVRKRYEPGELAKVSRDVLTVYYAMVSGWTYHREKNNSVSLKRIDDVAKHADQKLQLIIAPPNRHNCDYIDGVILPLARQLPQKKPEEICARNELIAACNRVREQLQPKHIPKKNPFAF